MWNRLRIQARDPSPRFAPPGLVKRLGRKTRLAEKQRLVLWDLFADVRARLSERGLITESAMFHHLAAKVRELPRPTFDFVVVDEAQDVSVGELRLLSALGGNRSNALFFSGDLGQRIFQQPFSWSSLGVDIRGRSSRLRINYRTSHQIRSHADRLLAEPQSELPRLCHLPRRVLGTSTPHILQKLTPCPPAPRARESSITDRVRREIG